MSRSPGRAQTHTSCSINDDRATRLDVGTGQALSGIGMVGKTRTTQAKRGQRKHCPYKTRLDVGTGLALSGIGIVGKTRTTQALSLQNTPRRRDRACPVR
ncbi:MAG: hypothetical protein ABI947_00970 [Chloroflexota bacterium]